MNNTIIEIINLEFAYNKKKIIDNISIEIKEKDKIGIIGSNGSGKTTLFHLICGVLKPNRGSIRIFDKNVEYEKFNPRTGYVFQNPDDQIFSVSVIEDIMFGLYNMGFKKKDAYDKSVKIAKEMNIEHLLDEIPHHLSLGEKRMVSIATVSVMDPDIIIFDEPSSNLDSFSRRKLINFINKLDKTLLISSHDLEFIVETCERVIIINNGKIISVGNTKEVFSDKEIMASCHQEIPFSLRNIY